jgi:hypothetical protein
MEIGNRACHSGVISPETAVPEQQEQSATEQRVILVLQIAGLLVTGWVMWISTRGLQWARVPLPWLLLRVTIYAIAACVAGALITVVIALGAAEWEKEDVIRASLRSSAAAVWFAPAVILLTQLSPAAIIPALVLVINATHMLYTKWRVAPPPPAEPPREAGLVFPPLVLPERRFWKEIAPDLAVSFTLQMGAAGVLLREPAIAGISFTACIAMLTVLALASRAVQPKPPRSMPRSFLALALTVLLAIGLTIGGMIPNFMRGTGEGGGDGNSAKESHPGMLGAGPDHLPPASAAGSADSGFPGVILWPEIKPIPTLIAPMPQTADGSFVPAMVRPLSIPFSGEYWLYRWPFARPPATSFFQRGTPSKLAFSSTDRRPIQMEARHKLDQPIALSCCSAIRLEIANADRFRGTISLELILIDNESSRDSWISLGRYPVNSMPDLSRDPVVPVVETLDFPVSELSATHRFDEFKIVFQRARWRTDKSARVAIERFILVPRI